MCTFFPDRPLNPKGLALWRRPDRWEARGKRPLPSGTTHGASLDFGGSCLVMMETLADFGTVSVLGVSTFTTAIYKAWFGFFSPTTAAQLSTGLLFFIAVIFLIEKKLRKNKSYTTSFRKISLKSQSFGKQLCYFL